MGVKSNAYFSSKFNTHESSFGVTVMTSSSESIHNSNFEDLKPLNQLIEIEPEYKPVISELTQNIFIIEDLSQLDTYREKLTPGQSLVDANGNIYGRLYQYLHGTNDITVDAFATKAKIEELSEALKKLQETNQSVVSKISLEKEKMDENKDNLSNLIEQRDVTDKELKALEI